MNKTTIIGNLGQDAQVRQTEGGKSFLAFSVAVSEKRGDQQQTTWFSCSAWGERFTTSLLPEFLKSGTKVYIEGKYAPSLFNRQDGSVDISHNLMVNQIELLSVPQPQANQVAQPGQAQAPQPAYQAQQPSVAQPAQNIQHGHFQMETPQDDDLPF